MKKKILILAALTLATVVNAASLNWNLANIYQPKTTTAAEGFSAYLFISAQSGDFGVKTTTVSDINSLITSGGDWSQYVAAIGTTNNKGMINGATGYNGNNFAAGDSLTAFAVVFDAANAESAKNYFITAEKSASWTSGTGAKALGFASQANATWTPVPEPSTAVLALAGLALLLKRRKA